MSCTSWIIASKVSAGRGAGAAELTDVCLTRSPVLLAKLLSPAGWCVQWACAHSAPAHKDAHVHTPFLNITCVCTVKTHVETSCFPGLGTTSLLHFLLLPPSPFLLPLPCGLVAVLTALAQKHSIPFREMIDKVREGFWPLNLDP